MSPAPSSTGTRRAGCPAGAWTAWERTGLRRDTCVAWLAPVAEPLATLLAFEVVLQVATALQGAPPSDGRRAALAALAGVAAHALFTLGHWHGTYRATDVACDAARDGWVLEPFASPRARATGLAAIFWRSLPFHVPMFLCFGLLPHLTHVPMLDLQLIALVFAFAGHRVLLHPDATRTDEERAAPPTERLVLAGILALAAVLRFADLDYNGEFIDESFYVYAREIGNLFFVSSDSRMWPMLAAPIYARAGIVGVRAATSLIGVLTVLCVHRLALAWAPAMDPDPAGAEPDPSRAQRHRHLALVAAFVTAVASPTLLTSVIGRHDALAFLTYAYALSQIARAGRADRPRAMLLGASALLLCFWTRYALLSYLPLAAAMVFHAQLTRRNAYLDALVPVALMALIWSFFDLEHWRIAWEHSRLTTYASPGAIVAESFARIPLVFVAAGLGLALLLARTRRAAARETLLRLAAIAIAALGTVGIVVAHVVLARTALSLDRNLTLAVIFASLPAGFFFVTAAQRLPRRATRIAVGGALAVVVTLHSWHTVATTKRSWGDPRPLIAAVTSTLERYRLGPRTVVWSTDVDGGRGNVHGLLLGLRGRAIVDNSSPWKTPFWERARDQEIPLIAGSNRADPAAPLEPGTEIGGYVVEQRVAIPYGPDAYVYLRRDLYRRARGGA